MVCVACAVCPRDLTILVWIYLFCCLELGTVKFFQSDSTLGVHYFRDCRNISDHLKNSLNKSLNMNKI